MSPSTNRILRCFIALDVPLGIINGRLEARRAFSSSLASHLPDLPPHGTRLYLVRHGETDWNKLGKMQGGGFDIPLNESGIRQAHALAEELREIPFTVIASSHLSRASMTADVVFQMHHPSTTKTRITDDDENVPQRIIRPEFGEFRFGKFEGMALHGDQKDHAMKKEFDVVNEHIYADINYSWPEGGESVGHVDTRMRLGLHDLLDGVHRRRSSQGQTTQLHQHICIVGHGRSNRVLLASLLRGDPLLHRDIDQGNTCINVLDVDAGGTWTARVLNYVEHIKG